MFSNAQRGFAFVELMIALGIGSLLLASMYSFYTHQQKIHTIRESIAEMQQNARIAMARMVREIRMARYDPTDTSGARIVAANANLLQFTMDIADDSGTGDPDGDIGDTNETLTYTLYDADGDGDLDLGPGGMADPIAENIQSLTFKYTMLDGTTTTIPANLGQIWAIQICLIARTDIPDSDYPENDGYRTYSLTSLITPRNLAL
jgi:prepilin-type N-terminal cleavage/methylation domain-containing protein